MARSTETRRIIVAVDNRGGKELKKLSKQFGTLNRGVLSSANSLRYMRNVFTGLFAAIGVREIVRISDSMELLNNRIAVLARNGEKSEDIMKALGKAASRTKTDIAGIAETYARLAAATKEMNIGSTALIAVTEVLQNTFRLSGATMAETTSVAIQLTQGLASGELRGQELRSVLEGNVEMGDILSKSLGKTRGELYKFAEAGRLTANITLLALLENAERVNNTANKLGQTIGQTVTVAFNDFKLKIFDVNKALGISGKFAEGVEFLKENMKSIAVIVTALAFSLIPPLVAAIHSLTTAMFAASTSNPLTLALLGTGVAVGIILTKFNELSRGLILLQIKFEEFALKSTLSISRFLGGIDKLLGKQRKVHLGLNRDIDRSVTALQELDRELKKVEDKLRKEDPAEVERKRREAQAKALADLKKKLLAAAGAANGLKGALGRMNREFLKTRDVEAYYRAFDQFQTLTINKQFEEGRVSLDRYLESLNKISQTQLNRELSTGAISLNEFNTASDNVKLDTLNSKLKAGTINLIEYNKEFNKLDSKFSSDSAIFSGVQGYIESIGSTADQIAGAITNTFKSVEDSFTEFIKTGKFNFQSFTQGILDDLTRIIVRAAIIRPLAEGILGNFGSGGATTLPASRGIGTVAAKGASFDRGVRKFASGGVINSPTLFGYGQGQTGIAGEAGSEAILPLKRGKTGDLGVEASITPVNINIINTAGAEIETRETEGANGEREVEVLILSKVREGIAGGAFDKTFRGAYGLKRKGS